MSRENQCRLTVAMPTSAPEEKQDGRKGIAFVKTLADEDDHEEGNPEKPRDRDPVGRKEGRRTLEEHFCDGISGERPW